MIRFIILLILCTSCSEHIHKKYKGYYKIGNQYTINDQTYFPQYYSQYIEMGIASWYSDDCYKCGTSKDCDKCVTANGEIFNKNLLTAAHRTLPMPSMVKVINLENGKSAILKVNDRGPFRNNRIIDVSEKAAEVLGFKHQGLAMVRIEYLKKDTDKLIKSKTHYKKSYQRTMESLKNKNILPSSIVTYPLQPIFQPPSISKQPITDVSVKKNIGAMRKPLPEYHKDYISSQMKVLRKPLRTMTSH